MHRPLWTATADLPGIPPLERPERCDVCVVGAGIAGLSTAYRLARDGLDVVVLESSHVAAGETHHTTAHLASAQDDRFFNIEKQHGAEGARAAAESHAAAIDWIERVATEGGIDCDFRRVPGYLFLGPDDEPETLDREAEAAQRAGLMVERLEDAPVDGIRLGPCLRFADQARFHPLMFVAGLVRGIRDAGGRVYGHSHVVDVADGEPCRVETAAGHEVTAGRVVLATNSPAGHYLTTMKMVPYRTFVTTLRLTADLTDALYWDTADPYHYVRLSEDEQGPLVLVGGGDYQTGTRDEGRERMDGLEAWARERLPVGEVAYRWSGQVLEPADSMAFIGQAETESNVYVCTGDSGQGMTHGVLAALVIGDLISGRKNPWAELYSPLRVSLSAAGEYVKDQAKVVSRFVDWLTPGEEESPGQVARGEGAVIRRGARKVAVYRDEEGRVHERSAVCTHAGCIVHWNSTERSWDCPCHGSRYSPDGDVLNGPAVNALAPLEEPADEDEGLTL